MLLSLKGAHSYRLLQKLGGGAQGDVFEAEDLDTGRHVAIKVLRVSDGRALARFKREFRIRHKLSHPSLVEFGELACDGNRWFFTMELIDGQPFLAYVRSSRKRLGSCLAQLADAVSSLHARGVVHRDLKPGNVLVDKTGRVIVLDLGLALSMESSAATEAGGTPLYMAPEQWSGSPTGFAADWYAVGVLLYEALLGRPPFEGSHLQIFSAKTLREPDPVLVSDPSCPADYAVLCDGLLRRQPHERLGARDVYKFLSSLREAPEPVEEAFIGREAELTRFELVLDRVRRGAAAVLVLEGPSGIGKSDLLQAFVRLAEKQQAGWVVTGRCYKAESVPFKAIDEALEHLAGALRQRAVARLDVYRPRHAQGMAALFPSLALFVNKHEHKSLVPIDPAELRARGLEAIVDLFARLSQDGPVVLCLDDVQWADTDSIEVLERLIQADFPLLLVMAVREAAEAPAVLREAGAVERIQLGPLAAEEARALATHIAPQLARCSQLQLDEACAEAAGSPFLLSDWARFVREHRTTPRTGLRGLLTARVARLSEQQRALLGVAAVVGGPVETALALRVAGADELSDLAFLSRERMLRSLARDGLQYVDVYHDRVRDSVLSQLDVNERQSLHKRIALELQRTNASAERQVAHQLAIGERTRAAELALEGARDASRSFAFARAAELYDLVMRLAEPPIVTRVELLIQKAEALRSARQPKAAGEALLLASTLCEDRSRAGTLRRNAGEQLMLSGELARGLSALEAELARHDLSVAESPQAAVQQAGQLLQQLLARGLVPGKAGGCVSESRIALCISMALSLHHVDLRGVPFALRSVLDALDAGEPSFLQQAYATFVMACAGRLPNDLIQAAITHCKVLTDLGADSYANALYEMAHAEAQHFRGDIAAAERACERAEAILLSSCVGVTRELGQVRVVALVMLHSDKGDFHSHAQRALEWLEDADRRGDVFAANWLRTANCLAWMAHDEPLRARAEIARAEQSWSGAQGGTFETACALYLDALDRYEDVPDVHERPAQARPSVLSSPVAGTPLLQGYLHLQRAWGCLRELGVRGAARSPDDNRRLREQASAEIGCMRGLGMPAWAGSADALEANLVLLDRHWDAAEGLLDRAYQQLAQAQRLALAGCVRRRLAELALARQQRLAGTTQQAEHAAEMPGQRWLEEADGGLRQLGVRAPARFARTYFSPFPIA